MWKLQFIDMCMVVDLFIFIICLMNCDDFATVNITLLHLSLGVAEGLGGQVVGVGE